MMNSSMDEDEDIKDIIGTISETRTFETGETTVVQDIKYIIENVDVNESKYFETTETNIAYESMPSYDSIPKNKRIKKTRAQINKDYRERRKKMGNLGKLPEERKPKKSRAQINKEYRERKKKMENLGKLPEENKPKKTRAQINKEYRERKKKMENLGKLPEEKKPKKTRAQISKDYRERKKLEANQEKILQEISTKTRKTNAQYQKEHRDRKKATSSITRTQYQSYETSPPFTPPPKKPKTHAERQRAYYQRQKQKILSLEEKKKLQKKRDIKKEYLRQYRLHKKMEKSLDKLDTETPKSSSYETSPPLTPPPKKPKTHAERQREYYKRQKQKLHENLTNNQESKKVYLRKYRLDKKMEKSQNDNRDEIAKYSSKVTQPKSRAQIQREYRARKKLLKQAHKKTSNKQSKLTNAQKCKNYRERKKKCLAQELPPERKVRQAKSGAQRNREYRARKKLLSQATKKKALTNAQKCKNYREQKKLRLAKGLLDESIPLSTPRVNKYRERVKIANLLACTTLNNPTEEINKKKPKTPAQRSKEYRERQKAKKKIKLHEGNIIIGKSRTNASAAYMKEYRRKKKLKNQITQLNTFLGKNFSNASKKSRKTPAEYQREYRQRQKIKNAKYNKSTKKTPKTQAQRQKEYRQRLKIRKEQLSTKKTRAEYQREYRQRQKLKTEKDSTKKTQAQYQREYRQRLKLKKEQLSPKKPPKTQAQRQREYWQRKKLRKEQNESAQQPKSAAQRNKEYRERKKAEKLAEASSSGIGLGQSEEISNRQPGFLTQCSRSKEYRDKKMLEQLRNEMSICFNSKKVVVPCTEISDVPVIKIEIDTINQAADEPMTEQTNEQLLTYTCFAKHAGAHLEFFKIFKNNTFGHSCAVCDRLWWKNEVKPSSPNHEKILKDILPDYVVGSTVDICSSCKTGLDRERIPLLSKYNGFSYPTIPPHLPALGLVSQQLISPRIPFMQIRRLRHVHGEYTIYGQIINVPVDVKTMVKTLPRNIDDDHCFYVHIKKQSIHKSSYLQGLVNKKKIKDWLTYLVETPLYVHHKITIDETFFEGADVAQDVNIDEICEHAPIEDSLVAQQKTLLWNESDLSVTTPGEKHCPNNILFDEYAEELSFPTIYGGQFRKYKENIHVTPFMQAVSELKRTDRRGADPQHLLYLATKIMMLRVRDCVTVAFKNVDTDSNITKEKIQNASYLNSRVETNSSFLPRTYIPNSAWYWADRKKDLFAMMRQKGAPTAFMTLASNEIEWSELLKLLHKLKVQGADVTDEFLSEMTYMQKATLVNDDAVTCAIYFSKLVNSLLHILMFKLRSPFGTHRVIDYFLRIEFRHQGTQHAHILLWMENVPANLLSNEPIVINMIDQLVNVSASEASGNIKYQIHRHTSACYKAMDPNKKQKCQFGAPFLPSKITIALSPVKDTDPDYSEEIFKNYQKHYKILRENLENFDYADFDIFYTHNNIESDEHYYNILRAGINRPMLFYKRLPSEKWHNPFNPFVLYHFKSNMEFQIIPDDFTCAAYISKYFNKPNRGISNLQRKILEVMNENPEFNEQMTSKLTLDLNSAVEMSALEAAWYLLRMPMAKSSVPSVYIPTVLPMERQRIPKTLKELEPLDEDSTDIWRENWFDKYEKRPEELNDVNLAQFVSRYYKNKRGQYAEKRDPVIIRYRNYDAEKNLDDYKREMVLLYIPFRNEKMDILAENKYLQLYDENQDLISQRRKQFESSFDIAKTLQIIEQLDRTDEEEFEEDEVNYINDENDSDLDL